MTESNVPERPYLRCTLDRFERADNDSLLAVLVFDDGQQLVVERAAIPEGAAKGSVLRITFAADEAETDARRQSIKNLQEDLFSQ